MKYYNVNGEIVKAGGVRDALAKAKKQMGKDADPEKLKDLIVSPAFETNTMEYLRDALSLQKCVKAGGYDKYYILIIKEVIEDDINNHIPSWLAAEGSKRNIRKIHEVYREIVSHYNDASLKATLAKWEQKASRFLHDCEDSDGVNFDFLILEEKKAVANYKEAIRQTDDPRLLVVLSRILKEESEHIEELEAARKGDFAADVTETGRKK